MSVIIWCLIAVFISQASSFSNKIATSAGDCLSSRSRRSSAYHNTSSQLQALSVHYGNEPVKHSALAQVLANQYGFDLSSVQPLSKEAGAKITAADVEYHAWKISQPPCTSEALEAAYLLGLNLNDLYDDEDREYVMNMGDIQLYVDNSRSLKMTSQVKKTNFGSNATKRVRKLNALDKRVEQNVEKLTFKAMQAAMTVTDGIVQQVKSQIRKGLQNPRPKLGWIPDMRGTGSEKLETVADFDMDLAIEIQEALTVARETSTDSVQSDDRQIINNGDSHGDNYVMKELQNMTCMQLKDELRQRGMKISGKKAELVDRLLYWADPVSAPYGGSNA